MSSKKFIELTSEQASYHNQLVLKDINLTINQGEKVALVGQSGSGKSTLLRLIYSKHSTNTALVPQDEGLVQTLSVFHNVYMGRLSHYSSWHNLVNLIKPYAKHIDEIKVYLEQLQLSEKIFEPVGRLSGGQRQRTAVARSLYQGGQLLLADEPVSSVDEQQANLVLTTLCQNFPTIILAMHDIELSLTYCDRIIGLDNGSIVLDQPSHELSAKDLLPLYRGELD